LSVLDVGVQVFETNEAPVFRATENALPRVVVCVRDEFDHEGTRWARTCWTAEFSNREEEFRAFVALQVPESERMQPWIVREEAQIEAGLHRAVLAPGSTICP
jgi:hypothetical protein